MRVIIACTIVLVAVLVAVVLTRINILNPPTSVVANTPLPNPQWHPNQRRRLTPYRRLQMLNRFRPRQPQ